MINDKNKILIIIKTQSLKMDSQVFWVIFFKVQKIIKNNLKLR